jgi:hypothetical protein
VTRRRWFVGTLLGAIAFRAALFFSGLVERVFTTGDSPEYRALARSLLEHGVFGIDGTPKMNRTPGYPAFLALVYAFFGQSQLAVTSAQIFIDALSCAMVVDIALRSGLSRTARWVVAVSSACCVFSAALSYQVMTETLFSTLLVASVWALPTGGLTAIGRKDAWRGIAFSGACCGAATLVRPTEAVTLIAFPLLLGALLLHRLRKRILNRRLLVPAFTFAAAAAVVVVPWMARNRIVFAFEYEKPDHSHVTLLGYKTDVAVYRAYYTPEFLKFKRSYEEPFVLEGPLTPPTVARYVYPGEEQEVRAAFASLAEEVNAGDAPITRETLEAFRRIGEKRYEAAPRLHVTAPISRFAKFWIVPRVSVLWNGRHGGNVGMGLTVGLTIYNCIYVVPGFLGLLIPIRRARAAWAMIVAMIVSQTALYAIWHGMPQSRYAIPFFPLVCLGMGAFVDRVRVRYRRFREAN